MGLNIALDKKSKPNGASAFDFDDGADFLAGRDARLARHLVQSAARVLAPQYDEPLLHAAQNFGVGLRRYTPLSLQIGRDNPIWDVDDLGALLVEYLFYWLDVPTICRAPSAFWVVPWLLFGRLNRLLWAPGGDDRLDYRLPLRPFLARFSIRLNAAPVGAKDLVVFAHYLCF